MDFTTTTTSTKSPDSENDTPPHIQPIKSLSFSNGVLKKHSTTHFRHQEPLSAAVVVYKECLKNHAASIGGHAVDGCGEFMASSTANPSDPTSFKCAACGCHRNFHRREYDEYCSPNFPAAAPTTSTYFIDFSSKPRQLPTPSGRFSTSPSPPPPPPNMLLSLSTAVQQDTPPTNHHHHNNHYHQVATPITPTSLKGENQSGRKRFRTKFTTEQKEKMRLFAEKLGWKLLKSDEAMIEEFCDEIGIARGVLKVWMHNNKHTSATKKDINHTNGGNVGNGGVISFENNKVNNNGGVFHQNGNNDDNNNHNNGSDQDDDLHVSNNGSSSSS